MSYAIKPIHIASILLAIYSPAYGCENCGEAVSLNNTGVRLLEKIRWIEPTPGDIKTDTKFGDTSYQDVFDKFEKATQLAPHYKKAQTNYAIARNNFGLRLAKRKQLDSALREFHKAELLDPSIKITQKNLNIVLSTLKVNPNSFDDRQALAEKLLNAGDTEGALAEYSHALGIREDAETRKKVEETLLKIPTEQANQIKRLINELEKESTAKPEVTHEE